MIKFNKSLKCQNLVRGRGAISGIILHDTAGSGTHNDTLYLAQSEEARKRKIGIDYTVERDGTVYELNPNVEVYYTAHAGRATNWRAKGLKGPAINQHCIGIEIVQKADMGHWAKVGEEEWPLDQVRAVAELCGYLCKTHRLTKLDITTHTLVITDGSRSDPRKWPFQIFWQYFDSYVNVVVTNPLVPVKETVGRNYHKVVKGDTLSKLAPLYNTTIEKLRALNGIGMDNKIILGQDLIVKE
jgi:LysM repeat protein